MVLELRLKGHEIRMGINGCLSSPSPYLQVSSASLLELLFLVNYITCLLVTQIQGSTVILCFSLVIHIHGDRLC